MAQTAGANKPIFKKAMTANGLPAVSFVDGSDFMDSSAVASWATIGGAVRSIYVYGLIRSANNGNAPNSSGTNGNQIILNVPGGCMAVRNTFDVYASMNTDGTFDHRFSGYKTWQANKWHKFLHYRSSGAVVKMGVDSFLDSALSTPSGAVSNINGGSPMMGSNGGVDTFDGLIAEYLLYNVDHSEGTRLLVQQYFADKYESAVNAIEGIRNIGSRRVRLLRRPIPTIPTR